MHTYILFIVLYTNLISFKGRRKKFKRRIGKIKIKILGRRKEKQTTYSRIE